MSGEKTEQPTARRKKEARKEGQVARTPELGSWAAVLMFAAFAPALVGAEVDALRGIFLRGLRVIAKPEPAAALDLLGSALIHVLVVLVVLGFAVMLIGVAGALAQGGFYVAAKSVQPSFKKLNPLQGAKRIFGPQAIWHGFTVAAKATLVTILVYIAIRGMMPQLGGLIPTATILHTASGKAAAMFRNVAFAGLVMAGAEYAFQRRRVGKQVRMTKEEVKQEHKQTEGDPLVRGAIRAHQMSLARSRMLADVPTADVVLVNPTHVSVALKYDPAVGAPTVVARGAGVIAARIREAAGEARVPLVRDVPLARALYTSCRVGQQIPPELFGAVAQVLAFVISRRSQGLAAGEHATPRDDSPLPEVPRRRPRASAEAR